MRKKKNIILMVFIGVLLIAVIAAVLVPKENTTVSWDCFSARFRLEQFLRAIEKGNYEKAFSSVYCYRETLDSPLSSNDLLQEIWVSRVEALRDGIKQTYLAAHSDVKIYTENGVMKGSVKLSVMEQGYPRNYETKIVFISDHSWKIAGISEETYLTMFEEVVSGRFTAEELSQEEA